MVERSRIILSRLEGEQIQQVAKDRGVSIPTVTKWCKRFSFWGIRGLFDEARSGKPAKYDAAFRDKLLAVLEEQPPSGMSRWDGPAIAERLESSVYAVWRLLRREGIHLQRHRSWCVSKDKDFASKAADVVGLYLNPPLNAVVLSVDEKPSIQAIERPTGYLKTQSGDVIRGQKSTYKRHGTINLFAALNVATGQVDTKITATKTRADFQSFLEGVFAEQPADQELHVILDNFSTHKKNQEWLKQFDGRVHFHFTPTSASWLNQVEIVFSMLQRKALTGASFSSKQQLCDAIEAYFGRHNARAKPFRWRKREVKGSQLRNTIVESRCDAVV